jgi:hypothetical protein
MAVNRNPSPLPPRPGTNRGADLWKEAYENIRHDPDDSAVYADFREILNAERGRDADARLSSESGKRDLLALINDRQANLQSRRTSQKVQRVLTVTDKTRGLLSGAASANPFSMVAVAGLFVAFDMKKMYDDASQAMLDIAIDTALIVCRLGVESHEINSQSRDETRELLDLRERLKEDYVQLYRTILLLTMKLVRTLSSKRRAFFRGFSDWPGERQNLEKMETRVTKSLETISRWRTNPPTKAPNWGIPKREELHQAARFGQTNAVFSLISSGKCGPQEINAKTIRGWTPLMFAVENGHYDIMDMLLDCRGIDVNAQNSYGRTALYMAAMKNRTNMMKRLIQKRAQVDTRDFRSRNAWLMMAWPGYLEALKILRAAGAELNQVTGANGWSALHGAVAGKHLDVVVWLVQEGVDRGLRVKDGEYKGMSAREMAEELGEREEIVKVLS